MADLTNEEFSVLLTLRAVLPLLLVLLLPGVVQARAPEHIASLDLCMDWALTQYAKPSQVLALSPMHQRYALPGLQGHWPTHDGSLEQLVQLQPDLVLAGQYSAVLLRGRLQALGVHVEVLPLPLTLAEIEPYDRRILQLLGLDPAKAKPTPKLVVPNAQAKRLLLLGPNGIGTGRDTFEQQIIEQAGWRNYLSASGYVQLDLELISRDPPDAILFAAPDHQALANRFAEHPVLRAVVPPQHWLRSDYWRWQCPGPWTWELIGQLHQWLD